MRNKKIKVLFLSSIPTSYQMDFLKEINKNEEIEIFTYFLWNKAKNLNWNLEIDKKAAYVRDFKHTPFDYIDFTKRFFSYSPSFVLVGGYNLPLSNFALILAWINSVKISYWLESSVKRGWFLNFFKKIYFSFKLKLIDCVFAIGKVAYDNYKNYTKNIVNLPYSMNLDSYYKINRFLKNKNEKINFLFSGQLIERKNVINLIRAFLQIENPNIRLNIIGAGKLEGDVRDLISNDKRISLIGFVQPSNLAEIYKKNDVFVFPSLLDGWALVINEAMASAMPIISTTNVGAANEFIIDGENGYVCGSDILSIMRAVEFYSNDVSLVYKHGLKNRRIIKNSCGDSVIAAKYFIDMIKKI